jgi:hypothetical protein
MKPGPKAFTSKVCPSCGIDKPRADYYKKGTGVSYRCKPCTLEQLRKDAPKYFGKYAEYQNEWRRIKYNEDADYKEKIVQQKAAYYQASKDRLNERRRERWATDPNNPARLHYRRKDVKDRTPPWVSKKALMAIYSKCPKNKEVDHIIPLRGRIDGRPVSGLHVPWNLQYLPKAENRKKHCRISEKDL